MQGILIQQCQFGLKIESPIFEDWTDIPLGCEQGGEYFIDEGEQVDQGAIIGDNARLFQSQWVNAQKIVIHFSVILMLLYKEGFGGLIRRSISVVVITPYLPAGGPGFESRIGHF